MFDDVFFIRFLIVFDMTFAVIIGKCVYNFMTQRIAPVNISSVHFVVTALPEKRKEVRSMVYLLSCSSVAIFLMMPVFVLSAHSMTLFYGICILTFLSIIYLMIFIHTMKKYEQLALQKLSQMEMLKKGAV